MALTERERQILRLKANGASDYMIAKKLKMETPSENSPEKGASVFTLKTFDKLEIKKERELGGKFSINAREYWRVRRELNPRPPD